MKMSASVQSSASGYRVEVATDAAVKPVALVAKSDGRGSAVSGGELLMLALATCYCNDLFREANRLGIVLAGVEVTASADFPGIGLSAKNIRYAARISSEAPAEQIEQLLALTDKVAEIHNTLREGAPVTVQTWQSSDLAAMHLARD